MTENGPCVCCSIKQSPSACLQVCSRCACLQLRWIPSTVRERLCRLTISWTKPGSPCLGIYTATCITHTLLYCITSCEYIYIFVCVCVSFPPASASYILLQFAQYGNILRHTVRDTHVRKEHCYYMFTSFTDKKNKKN